MALKYLSSVIAAANHLMEIKASEFEGYVCELQPAYKPLKPILRWVPVFSIGGTTLEELIVDYLKYSFSLMCSPIAASSVTW